MRYLLTLETKRFTGGTTDSTLVIIADDFDEPLVVGKQVHHGGADWRVDELDKTTDPPSARLVRERA